MCLPPRASREQVRFHWSRCDRSDTSPEGLSLPVLELGVMVSLKIRPGFVCLLSLKQLAVIKPGLLY